MKEAENSSKYFVKVLMTTNKTFKQVIQFKFHLN